MIVTNPHDIPKDLKTVNTQNYASLTAMRMVQAEGPSSEAGATPSIDPPPYSATQHQLKDHLPLLPPPQRAVRPIQRSPAIPSRDDIAKRSIATNFLILRSKHEPVKGTFFLDPSLTTFALDKNSATTVDRSQLMRKFKQRHRHYKKGAFRKKFKNLEPNAIFGSRSGPINVELSLVCPPEVLSVQRTLVQASSKSGDIDIRVTHIHTRRRLNLEVASCRGNVVIFIPRSFEGYIQTYTRKGTVKYLPALTQRTALMSQTNNDKQVFIGDSQPICHTEWSGDTIHVDAGKGDIFIGYIGEDSKPVEQPGFWKKFANALTMAVQN